jgi:purine-binding chemotaxis protein CheW
MAAAVQSATRDEHLIAFSLAGETYAVDIGQVQEIVRLCAITQIPRAASGVEGVINLRGRIVPIVDLRSRLGLPAAERDSASRVVIVETGGQTVGVVVDAVTGVIRISESDIELPSALIGGAEGDCVRGVGKIGDRLVILLDIDRALCGALTADGDILGAAV